MPDVFDWNHWKQDALLCAHACVVSYADKATVEHLLSHRPSSAGASLSDNYVSKVRHYIDVKAAGDALLAKHTGNSIEYTESERNKHGPRYDIQPIQVKNSSAMVLIPEDAANPAVVVFTGSNDLQDWIKNFKAHPSYSALTHTPIHAGMNDMFNHSESAQPAFHTQVMDYVKHNVKPGQKVLFTGHSMGGAMAALAAHEWVSMHAENKNTTKLLTYSAASLGFQASRKIGEVVGIENSLAIMDDRDIVPLALRSAQPGMRLDYDAARGEYTLSAPVGLLKQIAAKPAEGLQILSTVSKNEVVEAHSSMHMLDIMKSAFEMEALPSAATRFGVEEATGISSPTSTPPLRTGLLPPNPFKRR